MSIETLNKKINANKKILAKLVAVEHTHIVSNKDISKVDMIKIVGKEIYQLFYDYFRNLYTIADIIRVVKNDILFLERKMLSYQIAR